MLCKECKDPVDPLMQLVPTYLCECEEFIHEACMDQHEEHCASWQVWVTEQHEKGG